MKTIEEYNNEKYAAINALNHLELVVIRAEVEYVINSTLSRKRLDAIELVRNLLIHGPYYKEDKYENRARN